MYAKKTGTHLPIWAAALVLVLALTLLLCACAKEKMKSEESDALTTAAPSTPTAAPTEPASVRTDTEPALEETTAPAPETETDAPETESIPADWKPVLNRTDISFFGPGESFLLALEDAPEGAEITWSTEDEAVAAVDEAGRVTAVGPGTVKVSAEVGGQTLSCWVRCQFEALPDEDAPALDKTDISFFGAGEFYRLTVSNVPEDAEILWTSEDYSVANVDETGRVTAVGPGTIKVTAQVGEITLSCWVRCQFAAPDKPRSSVADGTWLVSLRKDRIDTIAALPGVYVANATMQVAVRVLKDYLDGLNPGDDLNLSTYGMGVYRVSKVTSTTDGKTCTVATDGPTLEFRLDETGKWTLVDGNGAPVYVKGNSAQLVFDKNSVCLDQMSAMLVGQSDPLPRENVMAFFGQQPGFENEVSTVGVTVKDGVVTQAIWYYAKNE